VLLDLQGRKLGFDVYAGNSSTSVVGVKMLVELADVEDFI
jgi:hypothetical protein